MLYKISGKETIKVDRKKFSDEEKLEKDLEDWIENNPSILGEDLLIIGRQVKIPEVNDEIDLLALDIKGNIVVIELKKGRLKDPVDIQSLRYASYVSRWGYETLENQAKSYFTEKGEKDFNFNEKFEEFCSEAGIDDIPDPNQDQRVMIVGNKLKEKLGSVALWLNDHSIDLKVIEVALLKDRGKLYLSPNVIIPAPTTEQYEIGKKGIKKDRPWIVDGKSWHLEKRCGEKMKEKLLAFNESVIDNFENLEGPLWNQKLYVSFKEGNTNWIYLKTRKSSLILTIRVKKEALSVKQVAKNLGIEVFDKGSSLSEKLQLGSSVKIENKKNYDRIVLRMKEDFNVASEDFIKFLKRCLESFRRI